MSFLPRRRVREGREAIITQGYHAGQRVIVGSASVCVPGDVNVTPVTGMASFRVHPEFLVRA